MKPGDLVAYMSTAQSSIPAIAWWGIVVDVNDAGVRVFFSDGATLLLHYDSMGGSLDGKLRVEA